MYCIACPFNKNWKPTSKVNAIKFIAVLLLSISLQVNAKTYPHHVTISTKDASLKSVFLEIEKQTGYHFIYTSETLRNCLKVSLDVRNASLKFTLDEAFKNQPLTYVFMDRNIVVKSKAKTIAITEFHGSYKNDGRSNAALGLMVCIKK